MCLLSAFQKYSALDTHSKSGGFPPLLSIIKNTYSFAIYTYTRATVSRQIASSSFVGITATFTLESGVEITMSSPLLLFASASNLIPKYPKCSQTFSRTIPAFSPIPAVNAIASTPFKAFPLPNRGSRWKALWKVHIRRTFYSIHSLRLQYPDFPSLPGIP